MTEPTVEHAGSVTPITPKKKAEPGTEYIVFEEDSADGSWRQRGLGKARSSRVAIREYLNELSDPSGTYVAVARRSWQPVKVSTEQKVQLRFS